MGAAISCCIDEVGSLYCCDSLVEMVGVLVILVKGMLLMNFTSILYQIIISSVISEYLIVYVLDMAATDGVNIL